MKVEKAFYISKSLLRNQEALEKKRKKPTALAPPLKRVLWIQKHSGMVWGWLLTTYDSCLWTQVSCTSFSSFQLFKVPERRAVAASNISPHVISDLQTTQGCQAAQWRHPLPGLHPFRSDRNLPGTQGERAAVMRIHPLLATAGGKEKVVPLPPPRKARAHCPQHPSTHSPSIILRLHITIRTPGKKKNTTA